MRIHASCNRARLARILSTAPAAMRTGAVAGGGYQPPPFCPVFAGYHLSLKYGVAAVAAATVGRIYSNLCCAFAINFSRIAR